MIVHCDKCGETVRFKPCDKLGVESVFCDCGEELGEVRVIFVPRRKGLFRISENSGDLGDRAFKVHPKCPVPFKHGEEAAKARLRGGRDGD